MKAAAADIPAASRSSGRITGMKGRSRRSPKIFCIGANKTGTTSVRSVLEGFGYKIGHQPDAEKLLGDWYRRDFASIIAYSRSATAFQDVPFSLPFTYIALDQHYPQAKFILTRRDSPEQWYESIVRFHSKLWADGERVPTVEDLKRAPYRYRGFAYDYQKFVFGAPDDDPYNRSILVARYRSHIQNVHDYFASRQEKLVTINVSERTDYRRLCEFLGVQSDEVDFPWKNRSS